MEVDEHERQQQQAQQKQTLRSRGVEQQVEPQSPDGTAHTVTLPPGKHNIVKDIGMQQLLQGEDSGEGNLGQIDRRKDKDIAMPPLRSRKKLISEDVGEAMMDQIDEQRMEKKDKEDKESLRIHISLDLDVEVHLSARIKGDITIGLL
jgi:hypothetical protein